MTDEFFKRDEVESPCVKVCLVHPDTGLCVGCRRSIDEIAGWASMGVEARRAVLAELPQRVAAPGRRGGRRARR